MADDFVSKPKKKKKNAIDELTAKTKAVKKAKEEKAIKKENATKKSKASQPASKSKKTSSDKPASKAKKTSSDKPASKAKKTSSDKPATKPKKTSSGKPASKSKKTSSDKSVSKSKKISSDKSVSKSKKISSDKSVGKSKKTSNEKLSGRSKKTLNEKPLRQEKKTAKNVFKPKDHKPKKQQNLNRTKSVVVQSLEHTFRRQNVLALVNDPVYVPMKAKEMAVILDVPKGKRSELYEILDELLLDGSLEQDALGRYSISNQEKLQGIYTANPKGFGFVTVEGYEQDFYINPDNINGAFHKDTVEIALLPKSPEGKRREAKITKILGHELLQVVGTYEKIGSFGFITPDDPKIQQDIYIPEHRELGARHGEKVLATISDYGENGKQPEGIVIELLGMPDEPGTDILSIVKAYGIPSEFPDEVMSQVNEIPGTVTKEQMRGRLDLRDITMVTIDGEDSKDLDDAISLQRDGDNYLLGVHIADVSEYVREKSPLDREALKRGTSVYLTDRVIPMLPKALSNGICSLNEGVDRLALSCLMTIDKDGRVISHEIAETLVKIKHRMTYHSVKLITEDKDLIEREKYADIADMLDDMLSLSKIVRKRRHDNGCIDFDFPETKIILDEKGNPIDIVPYEHSSANELIEDFMILANVTVAEEFARAEIPFLYRSHEEPDGDKIHDLGVFIQAFGLSLHPAGDELRPKDIQNLMNKILGRPEEALISRLTLRSMQQAKYTTDPLGHFGLAEKYYCHFTSPIRRYPDLQIHRIIKEKLHGELSTKRIEHFRQILPAVATQTSQLERREDEAERETDKLKKAQYMQMHIGEVYDGVVSGITGWGLYVELPNTIEGLLHISNITDDYYIYHENSYELVGERTGRTFKMGIPVTIRVEGADTETRTIDFQLMK